MSIETLIHLGPEIFLALLAVGMYLGGTWVKSRTVWGPTAAVGFALCFVGLWFCDCADQAPKLLGPVSSDAMGYAGRLTALGVGFLMALIMGRSTVGPLAPAAFGSLVLVIVGMMLTVGAQELVLMFLGLELITIPTYVLLYIARKTDGPDQSAQESAVKYFFLSVFAAAVLLYGFSFLYGAAGSTDLPTIRARLAASGPTGYEKLALVFIVAGLCFKITAVPFHFYAPDVYQGTSNPAMALLSIAPKFAGFTLLVRVATLAMPGLEQSAWYLGWTLAALTMTWGNFMALWQHDLRRLLAYSSIAHAGYILIGVTMGFAPALVKGFDPTAGVMTAFVLYAVALIGVAAAVTYLGKADRQINDLEELAGLGTSHPLMSFSLAVCLLSLAGIPPLAGFWGKFVLFGPLLSGFWGGLEANDPAAWWMLALAVIGVLNAAVAAANYLRFISVMYFRPSLSRPAGEGGLSAAGVALLCMVLVIGLGLFPRPVLDASFRASVGASSVVRLPVVPLTPKVSASNVADAR